MERLVKHGLKWLFRVEATFACAALALVVGALLADVLARELLGNGLFGAQRFAVYCNAIAGLMGFSIVVHTGGHMRIALVDKLFPASWHAAMQRSGDTVSCVLCLLLGYFALVFVKSTFAIGETDAVFQVRTWPMQAVVPYIFLLSALRYGCYAVFPQFRPQESEFS